MQRHHEEDEEPHCQTDRVLMDVKNGFKELEEAIDVFNFSRKIWKQAERFWRNLGNDYDGDANTEKKKSKRKKR